eukprot:GHVT01089794.1.p1 GENE.GHVT01089794.1~~GHVT01089794.1.p1  ORF type:complete len:109 (-),score=2.08 GHVT01089794.1:1357-1683(-)
MLYTFKRLVHAQPPLFRSQVRFQRGRSLLQAEIIGGVDHEIAPDFLKWRQTHSFNSSAVPLFPCSAHPMTCPITICHQPPMTAFVAHVAVEKPRRSLKFLLINSELNA